MNEPTPYAKFTSALYQRTEQAPNDNDRYCCPAHDNNDDSNPSLSVSQGDDGRVLLECLAECSTESICAAIGLEMRDLIPNSDNKPIESVTSKPITEPIEPVIIEPITEPQEKIGCEEYQPFPADCLPYPLNELIKQGADSICCDMAYIALPLISALAASIGSTTRLQVKYGWEVPSVLWTVIVGESGCGKSPAFELVMSAIRKKEWESAQQYKKDMAEFNSIGTRDEEESEEPIQKRCLVDDTTVEALAPIFEANPRGLLLANDELNNWFGSFTRYKKGNDSSRWLSMYGAGDFMVDRKTGEPRTIMVRGAAMSITGGIQPGVLRRSLGDEHRESGMAARFLFACPPRKERQWSEKVVNSDIKKSYSDVIEGLRDLEFSTNRYGETVPRLLKLSVEAKQLWVDHVNRNANEQLSLTGDISAAWSKLEETPARLAIVIHCVRQVTQPDMLHDGIDVVDSDTMRAAIKLTEWFKNEARRIYAMLNEEKGKAEHDKLVSFITKKGTVSVRDVCRKLRIPSDDAERQLNNLVKQGIGQWEDVPSTPQGRRPTRVFTLTQ